MNFEFSIISTAILIMFVIDPFGNVPVILSILKDVELKRRRVVIIREMPLDLASCFFFLFESHFLKLFHLETEAVRIASAPFVIGIKLISPSEQGSAQLYGSNSEPFVVPIAMPLIAGPSALATLLVMSKSHANDIGGLFYIPPFGMVCLCTHHVSFSIPL